MKTDPSNFDTLPNSALVNIKMLCAVSDIAESTAWRRCSLEPDFPQPIKLGPKCTRFKVADIRAFLQGVAA
ncbi:AlpA family phage regulatory protein [Hydrogenophaga sp. PAMC20947]|uniref:helix-turn-helix transcriptional regulator n=1 Tax=Hydrogenophaga sp. PAMC20947 TaxID=2565558 RepID=UPI00109DCA1B|nr:AlpA family phage regulatory protein [Hydrogenophaga sp. PAMC20947]QCB46628.1 AlpA family phage regulatory protein [Hydrogenophaga sp. PAMC20947]